MPRKRRTYEEFLAKVSERHGDRYVYDPASYKDGRIDIMCKEHGWFNQSTKKHIEGQGCRKCSAEKRGKMFRESSDALIKRFREVHGVKYDYSAAFGDGYKNVDSHINITCPVHGSFSQTVQKHLKGQGCSKCRDEVLSARSLNPYPTLLEKIEDVHNGLISCTGYEGEYIGQRTIITMMCNRCGGNFSGYGHNILRGQSCPSCSEYGYSNIESTNLVALFSPCYLYILKMSWGSKICYKVGISSTTRFYSRASSIGSESKADECSCVGLYKSTRFDCLTKEQGFHRKNKHFRDIPEIKYSGWTEVYTEDAIPAIDSLVKDIKMSGTFEESLK